MPHPKWEERPILLIEPHDGADVCEKDLVDFLKERLAKWWMPDRIIFGPVPLNATGKIDKKKIRDLYRDSLT